MTNDEKTSNVTDVPFAWEGGKDGLEMGVYARSLVTFINQAATPFTIAIQGEWGSGKTSLMRQIFHNLCGELREGKPCIQSKGKDFCGVWLDTWECGLMRSPKEIQIQVISGLAETVGNLSGTTAAMRNVANEVTKPLLRLTNLAIGAALHACGLSTNMTALLEKSIKELLHKNESQNIKKFRSQLIKAVDHIKKKYSKGIIFFIDDLDRIPPKVAVDVLEILKNLFEVDGCIFVLAIDYNVVVQGLESKFGGRMDENGRNFHSFFHKIIQLPFSMPVAKYGIGTFLDSMLEGINYCDRNDLGTSLGKDFFARLEEMFNNGIVESDNVSGLLNVSDLLQRMLELSTSKNPRSIKRLVNSLSLIKIILDEQSKPLSNEQKWLCFGVVCVQISYPRIYDMFLAQPDFIGQWDQSFARRQGLTTANISTSDKATGETANHDKFEKFEPWQQVTYLVAQTENRMKALFYNILSLLTLLAACVDKKELEQSMRYVLALTATTGTSAAAPQKKRLSRDEFLDAVPDDTARNLLKKLLSQLDVKFKGSDGAWLKYFYMRDIAEMSVVHTQNSPKKLLFIRLKGEKVQYEIGYSGERLDFNEEVNAQFFEQLTNAYNEIADESHQLKC